MSPWPWVNLKIPTRAALPMKTRMNVPNSSARYFCHCAFMEAPRDRRTTPAPNLRSHGSLKAGSDGAWGLRRVVCRRRVRQPFEIGEADLHQRANGILEARLARDGERLLVALARFRRIDSLLQPIVTGDEQALYLRARFIPGRHTVEASADEALLPWRARWCSSLRSRRCFSRATLIGLVLMHSGRDAGFGGIGFTPQSQGGTHIVERNLTRLTVLIAVLFTVNTVVLYRLLA